MTNYPPGQICLPPELPSYLKNISDLKAIVGVPNDEEMFGIHAVIRMAQRFVDIPDICTPGLLSRLSDHLFNAQMARYRSQYPCSIFHTDTTYTPPVLPAHVSANLEPVSGPPSNEQIVKVQEAFRLYQRFADIPTMFDAQVDADLSQHLFNLQMESYLRRNSAMASPLPQETVVSPASPNPTIGQTDCQVHLATNNPGTGDDEIQAYQPLSATEDIVICDALERSNCLVEQANQLAERSNVLIERSNEIAERANQLAELSIQLLGQPNPSAERFNELYGQLNKHFEASNRHHQRSNTLVEESTKPVAQFGDVLRNINSVLVGIQHAIIRNHKGNTLDALDCLVNVKGEKPGVSGSVSYQTFKQLSSVHSGFTKYHISVLMSGIAQDFFFPNARLGEFLSFYGIGDGICVNKTSSQLRDGKEAEARERLSRYLSSCVG